jgi:hypothetical protein
MRSPFDTLLIPGLFMYKDCSGQQQGLLFQFNPETLKRSRTVSLEDSSTSQNGGTTTGNNESGRKYSLKAARWKIDLELRLDASRSFPKQLGMMLANAARLSGTASAPSATTLAENAVSPVLAAVRQLEALVEPTIISRVPTKKGFEEHADPPEVDFYWGTRIWKGFVTSLTINEALWSALLMPMVVEASISLEIIEPVSSTLARAVGGTLFK